MNGAYLIYFLLGALVCFGAKLCPRGEWNGEYTSRDQTKILTGIMTLGVVLHHLAQKTCAPWIPATRIYGLEFFLDVGFPVVGVFFFCSGLGLYRSLRGKPDYLKGFVRRRVLRIVVAFYLSEWIYTVVRLLMGEKMNAVRILWYLSGLHMANTYSWYAIVIPFFYLVFWAAFRFCRREGTAIFWVFVFTLAYTVLGAFIDHQNDWWMRGEWWYNSVILFPLGLLFGRFEKPVTRFLRKGWLIWLLLAFAAVILLYIRSDYLVDYRWGYYRQGSVKVPFRLLSAGCQWLVCVAFVLFCFLLMMKVRIGNKALAWLGAMSLEVYLMHGLFVEMFGYNFLDSAVSAVRITNVPLYTAAVLACSVPAALAFRWICRQGCCLLTGGWRKKSRQDEQESGNQVPEKIRRLQAKYQAEASGSKAMKIFRTWFLPVLLLLLTAVVFLSLKKSPVRVIDGVTVVPPDGYTQRFSDSRYVAWEYSGEGKKPGKLVLDTAIKGSYAQMFTSAEEVMADCSWLKDAEIYTNPQGIRMVRGFDTDESGYLERRYYVETGSSVFLLSMIEDSRYYDPEDCEEAMRQTADGIKRN